MRRKEFSDMHCSTARALDQIGEWWSLLIVRQCTEGARRFDEFQSELGIARNVLTTRLERLTELEIIERYPLEERANTFGYRLTKKGEDLYPVIVALMQWGDRWTAPQGKARVDLVDARTGAPIERMVVREKGGRPLSFKDVRFTPGPGATSTTQKVIAARNERVLGD